MAPTKRKTKPKPEKTKVGEQVLDLVIPYIYNVEDRNSISLVSRKFYEIDGITRKRVTVHTLYYPDPPRLSKRFPFMETLTLKGPPFFFILRYHHDNNRLSPWIEQLALGFRYLKELHIHRLVVLDEDLETLARTRGMDLRSLKISKCQGFSTDGLRHVSKYCNQLRSLCLEYWFHIEVKDGIWLHQLALNSSVLERFHVTNTVISNNTKDLTLLAKNCCNSLISLKIGKCYLSKLVDAFRYAVRLEHFSGDNWDEESDQLVGFQLPPSMRSLSIKDLPVTLHTTVLPFLNQIRKLKLVSLCFRYECQCLLFKRCPNLEVLSTEDVCGDAGLQVIGQFCKKLRKLIHKRFVTHVGLIALANGCTNLESLKVSLGDISNEALECLGAHLKNLRKFRMYLTTDLQLDNGIRAMLMGCRKLERLDISLSLSLSHGGLTDVGLEYIAKYGANLRSLSLTLRGNSNAGFVKLTEGCPRLRKLKLRYCPFSKQAVASSVFNLPSLRYVWAESSDFNSLALTRPEFELGNIGRSKSKRKSPTSDNFMKKGRS